MFAIWRQRSALILSRSRYCRCGVSRATSGDGFIPRNTSIGHLAIPFSFFPRHSTGEWFIILWMTSNTAGRSPVDNHHSDNNAHDMHITTLHKRSTVPFAQGQWAICCGKMVFDMHLVGRVFLSTAHWNGILGQLVANPFRQSMLSIFPLQRLRRRYPRNRMDITKYRSWWLLRLWAHISSSFPQLVPYRGNQRAPLHLASHNVTQSILDEVYARHFSKLCNGCMLERILWCLQSYPSTSTQCWWRPSLRHGLCDLSPHNGS